MKTITINDGFTTRDVYTLDGERLTTDIAVSSAGHDVLNRRGCTVSERMPDDEIAAIVRDVWSSGDYEGDPDANGLTVIVSD